ncbi:family 16 glycosylhydrolase [Brevifollis gellanilyticus]|uniref:family 16 glycosylhydrolase n=1 Tax=Brevifollis gellanilyticus TaxID=748831 RepID=UPI001C3F7E86|nr:family 16 glycosylhydrolase [Brevifollis gellanilyticus]
MWINRRFKELGALALSLPAIKQRLDGGSDNSYSILPYLARAGIVDANILEVPERAVAGPIISWTACRDQEGVPMALSMLGFRVRVFDGDEDVIQESELMVLLQTFDALVDVPLSKDAFHAAIKHPGVKFVLETNAVIPPRLELSCIPLSRTAFLPDDEESEVLWQPLCSLLGLAPPIHAFPIGAPRKLRIFRDDRSVVEPIVSTDCARSSSMDDSPWALIPKGGWQESQTSPKTPRDYALISRAAMTAATPLFRSSVGTFPGNQAGFDPEGMTYSDEGAHLALTKVTARGRPYRSGSFATVNSFAHGRFEAEIKAARGSGLVTGFFLYRDCPRQEIDIELTGDDPHRMLVNVYFNPGDEGVAIGFGYRGSPCRIELGFDATQDYHLYAIEWRPGLISWSVDDKVVHQRVGWDPTPLPHLPMHLNANLWAPRSEELAGRLDESVLPATASFRNVSIWRIQGE